MCYLAVRGIHIMNYMLINNTSIDMQMLILRLIVIMDARILLRFSKVYVMQGTSLTEFMTYRAQSQNHNWLMCNPDM